VLHETMEPGPDKVLGTQLTAQHVGTTMRVTVQQQLRVWPLCLTLSTLEPSTL
jgi:hypothetical protein